ncbi:MAG: Crp/Fnr family transcriptional regulator [Anaerolineales bacterium]
MRLLVNDLQTSIKVLAKNPYFLTLPGEAVATIAEATRIYCFCKDEIVFLEGEACAGLYFLEKGSVRLFRTAPNGREIIINVLNEGASFNEVPVFDGGTNPVNVSTLEESIIWIIDKAAIQACMFNYPEMAKAVIFNLTQNLRYLVNFVDQLSLYRTTQRLAYILIHHSSNGVYEYPTQDQLAARLGTVREVIARSLHELEHCGAIKVKKHKIEILNIQALQEWISE